MSGHNKWSKIKHKKAASDSERSKLFSKHAAVIAMESRKAKGDLSSPSLFAAIERAKKDSMPKENIDRAVNKGSGLFGATLEEVLFETFGPRGVAILITAITDNNNRTSQEIKHLLVKNGYSLGAPGSAAWAFTKKIDNAYLPNNPQQLNSVYLAELENLLRQVAEHDDVQNIYTTIDQPDNQDSP